MRAKLDENLPVEAAELLRSAGWECDTVHDEGLAGAGNPEVAAACRADTRLLFTLDLHFSDIRAYPPSEYVGIVVLRPNGAQSETSARIGDPRPSGVVRGMGSNIGSGSWSQRVFGYRVRRSQPFDSAADRRTLSGCRVTQV